MVLSNDEIEVACDALWSVKLRGAGDEAQELHSCAEQVELDEDERQLLRRLSVRQ